MRVADRVALVTGAARGIGKACALRLAAEGAHVVALDVAGKVETVPYEGSSVDELEQTVEEVRSLGREAIGVRADVRSSSDLEEAAQRAIDQFAQIDILVAAAGVDSWGPAWKLTESQWKTMIDVNLSGVWLSARSVASHMIEEGRGSMVFIGSVLSHKPNALFAHYTAAKHGVLGLTRAFALELAPHNVRVNSVDPTAVATPMIMNPKYLEATMGSRDVPEREVEAHYKKWNALPVPWVEPIDVANAVLFLSSDESRYITGVSLPVDAGALLK